VPYPDVERLLVTYLGAALGVRVVTDLPANLQQILGGVTVSRVRTGEGPAWRPYDDTTNVRRFGATYEITTRYRY
jgi:hypothetical protein